MRAFDRYRARRLAGYLTQAIQPGGKVLDLGCGRMEVARYVKETLGGKISGVDIINVNQTDLDLCIADARRLPFSDQSLDTVYVALVLHHTLQPREVLQECMRITRSRLIILEDVYTNPFEHWLLKALDWLGNRTVSPDMPFPFNFKSEAQWRALFEEVGLTLRDTASIRPVPWRLSRHRMFVLEPACQPLLNEPSPVDLIPAPTWVENR